MPHDQVVVTPASTKTPSVVYETWVHNQLQTGQHPSSSTSSTPTAASVVPALAKSSVSVPGFTPAAGAGFAEELRPLTDPLVRRAWNFYVRTRNLQPPPSAVARMSSWVKSYVSRYATQEINSYPISQCLHAHAHTHIHTCTLAHTHTLTYTHTYMNTHRTYTTPNTHITQVTRFTDCSS
jgi:hypothetical protein